MAEQGAMSTTQLEKREQWADVRLDVIKQAETALKAILEHQGCVKFDFGIADIQVQKMDPNTSARTNTLLRAYAILRSMPVM
jgi:predicted deacylase